MRHAFAALAAATSLLGSTVGVALAVPLTPGNVVIYRVGSGTGTLGALGNPVFLDEYNASGGLVQSIPTGVFANGNTSNEGMITLSSNGQYVMFSGFESSVASGSVGTITAGVGVRRVIGRMSLAGVVELNPLNDNSTLLTGQSPRAVASTDGTRIWYTGTSSGVRTLNWGDTTSTAVYAPGGTPPPASPGAFQISNNIRNLHIAGGQLYASAQTTGSTTPNVPALRIFPVGTGLPTSTVSTVANLAGIPLRTGAQVSGVDPTTNPNQMVLLDLSGDVPGVDTMYVADENNAAIANIASGGIQKWSLVGGSWVWNGTVAALGARGLTAFTTSGAGVSIYATTGSSFAPAGGGTLWSYVDAGGYNTPFSGTATTLATLPSGSNRAFRGIAVIPEPAALGLLAPAALLLSRRRK